MTTIRRATEDDRSHVAAIDTSFTTESAYQATGTGLALTLERASVDRLTKAYALPAFDEDVVLVAEREGSVVGVAAVGLEEWNTRARLEHLYVAPEARGTGVGRALVEAAADEARGLGARCLWAETQNVNPDAIAFYERAGFRFCGFDLSLYDPVRYPGEFAIFLAKDVA